MPATKHGTCIRLPEPEPEPVSPPRQNSAEYGRVGLKLLGERFMDWCNVLCLPDTKVLNLSVCLAEDGKGNIGQLIGLGNHRRRGLDEHILPREPGGFQGYIRIHNSPMGGFQVGLVLHQ